MGGWDKHNIPHRPWDKTAPWNLYSLNFDAQRGGFTPGKPIIFTPSGASAIIISVIQNGDTGILSLGNLVGVPLNNDIISESALGSELVIGTDADMSGPNNWVNDNLGTFDINTTVAGKAYLLGDGGQDACRLPDKLTIGKTYFFSLKARLNAGASTTIKIGHIAGNYVEITPIGTEDTYASYLVATHANFNVGLAAPGFNGIAFEIDDVSAKEAINVALANGVVF